ncbi:uncharacterized protein L969DRAFT_92249 [Mixia osmundae IAM 14324]|uniref:Zn(2)-C6 fungal-type domain-containing protein n=1 Tax=Mixia osmundae (strain CBS 9802 / IAM 14324 / JCM 22182 / KY 12970) TaxID=764103 RepID=G7DTI8_MIXOS|nr:uncharacterized protein L969DRAFT_92249 [Mixia osmundae IAM 14324]KEI42828.1 hypothetical protein L969DRAFT_92249 [Mixia osmundae IAM 14324]GAA93835.1 hypothetical protein E5Q_00481 [Mixia osmundae IAM 14324]
MYGLPGARQASANTPSSDEPAAKKQRNRPILSCANCRQRKLRCDRQTPCGTCVHRRVYCANLEPLVQPLTRDAVSNVSTGASPRHSTLTNPRRNSQRHDHTIVRPVILRASKSQPPLLTSRLAIDTSMAIMSAPSLSSAFWSNAESASFESELPGTSTRSLMLQRFFANVNTVLPLVHPWHFERNSGLDPALNRPSLRALTLAMVALGGLTFDDYAPIAARCFRIARNLLSERRDDLDLEWLTASTLMLFYASSLSLPCASYILALTVKAAMQARVHHSDEPRWTSTLWQSELRKRIWWSLAMADMLQASPLHALAAFNPRAADFELPLPIDDTSLDLGRSSPAAILVSSSPSGLSMLRFNEMIRFLILARDALAAIRLAASANNLQLAAHCIAQMEAHENRFAQTRSQDDSDKRYLTIYRAVLRIIVHRSLMACVVDTAQDAADASRQIVAAASRRVHRNIDVLLQRDEAWPLLACFANIADPRQEFMPSSQRQPPRSPTIPQQQGQQHQSSPSIRQESTEDVSVPSSRSETQEGQSVTFLGAVPDDFGSPDNFFVADQVTTDLEPSDPFDTLLLLGEDRYQALRTHTEELD